MTAAVHRFQAYHVDAAYRVLENNDATTLQRLSACDVLDRHGSPQDQWIADQIRIALAPEIMRQANREMAADILAGRRHTRRLIALAALAGLCLGAATQLWPGVF